MSKHSCDWAKGTTKLCTNAVDKFASVSVGIGNNEFPTSMCSEHYETFKMGYTIVHRLITEEEFEAFQILNM